MKNSILMGGLVLATALLPSFAAADSASYNLDVGTFDDFRLDGGPTDVPNPVLSQTEGVAVVLAMVWIPDDEEWVVTILCVASLTGVCEGQVSN